MAKQEGKRERLHPRRDQTNETPKQMRLIVLRWPGRFSFGSLQRTFPLPGARCSWRYPRTLKDGGVYPRTLDVGCPSPCRVSRSTIQCKRAQGTVRLDAFIFFSHCLRRRCSLCECDVARVDGYVAWWLVPTSQASTSSSLAVRAPLQLLATLNCGWST